MPRCGLSIHFSGQQCLGTIQRLILHQAVDTKGAGYITETVWGLMRSNIEEVKLLQTVALLLTTNAVAQGETLAKVRGRGGGGGEKRAWCL